MYNKHGVLNNMIYIYIYIYVPEIIVRAIVPIYIYYIMIYYGVPEFSLAGWSAAAEVVSRPKDKFLGTIKKKKIISS